MGRHTRRKAATCLLLSSLIALALLGCGEFDKAKTVVKLDSGEKSPAQSASDLPASWYGWWSMDDVSGDWEGLSEYWWDCCAELSEKGGNVVLLIWDEDLPKDDYLAKLVLEPSSSAYSCVSGEFMSMKLDSSDCSVRIQSTKSGLIMRISGSYYYKSVGSFSFSMRLRPWGDEWTEGADELPYYYEDWYLPLIRDGKPMPDTIG